MVFWKNTDSSCLEIEYVKTFEIPTAVIGPGCSNLAVLVHYGLAIVAVIVIGNGL